MLSINNYTIKAKIFYINFFYKNTCKHSNLLFDRGMINIINTDKSILCDHSTSLFVVKLNIFLSNLTIKICKSPHRFPKL